MIDKFLWTAVLIYLAVGQAFANIDEVHLLTSEHPPYISKKFKNQGALSEIVVKSYALVGVKAKIVLVPWNTAIEHAKKGTFDGLFPVWHTQERTQHFVFSKPFSTNLMGFYKRKGEAITFNRFKDLKPYRIGIVKGYAYPKAFFDANLKSISVTKDEQHIALLCQGLIDLALTDKSVGMYIVNNRYSECANKIEWLTPAIRTEPNYLVISRKVKDHRIMMATFNRGLLLLQQQDGVRKILQKHGLPHTPDNLPQ